MNPSATRGPEALAWTSVEVCTLPTVDRPLRLAEFDDLFATTLQSVDRSGDAHARLLLVGDGALVRRARQLADAESACCSFFGFGVSLIRPGLVALDIEVPLTHADVLAGLLARAEAVRGQAS